MDLVIRGGVVVDGSGAPATRADVAIRDGRIVQVGKVTEVGAHTIDIDGLVVVPGFVDLHTHYDAQLFYEPELPPSPLHGATTVIAGNCRLTLAPVNPGDEPWLARLLARVESIPVSTLDAGLDEALAAGGLGFSTANAATQVDGDGRPTPPNFATRDEFVALAAVCGRHVGTVIEFIPDSFLTGFTDEDVALMADMSAAANRVLNWNKPLVNQEVPDLYERQLRASDVAAARGGRVVAMMTPQNGLIRHDFEPGYVFPSGRCPDGGGSSSSTRTPGWRRCAIPPTGAGSRRRPRRPRAVSRWWCGTGRATGSTRWATPRRGHWRAARWPSSRANGACRPSRRWPRWCARPGSPPASCARSSRRFQPRADPRESAGVGTLGADERRLLVGVDIGGTFTDAVCHDGARTWRAKAATTPGRLADGVLAALALVAERRGSTLESMLAKVSRLGLGTTAVTNVLAARAGRRVGLLVTRGFESMLPLARGTRVLDADGWMALPPPIVAPGAIVGIDERVDRDGNVVTPLDPAVVVAAVARLVEEHAIEALAVSYLWSFVNPTHEAATVAVVRDAFPRLPVVAGSELHPVIREYERTTHAVLNAYVSGALEGIEALESRLAGLGLPVPLLLVGSAGGSITVAEARRQPLALALSGPAAGVAAAVEVGAADGTADLITADMGGTSFDVSVIVGGSPARRTRGDLMGVWTALSRVDVVSIGAGGGSLGWIDARNVLRVGPQSAGAEPGPACYGRGGTEPTVTDALVVLGFLDPQRFLGGDFVLDADAARDACARLGARIGLDADETAWGIRQLALAGMIKATRARVAAFGLDPREHTLASFGGSGALFTPEIAAAIGAPRVLVPELASVLSAFGAATADVRRERIRAVLGSMPVDAAVVEKLAEELTRAVDADLEADGVAPENRRIAFEADLRFAKQSVELTVALRGGTIDPATLEHLVEDFRDEYARRFGRGSIVLGTPIEMVALRAVGIGRTPRARLPDSPLPPAGEGTPAPPAGSRTVMLDRGPRGWREVRVFDRDALAPGHVVAGPALVDGSDTTVWVPPGASAVVDRRGTLVVSMGGGAAP